MYTLRPTSMYSPCSLASSNDITFATFFPVSLSCVDMLLWACASPVKSTLERCINEILPFPKYMWQKHCLYKKSRVVRVDYAAIVLYDIYRVARPGKASLFLCSAVPDNSVRFLQIVLRLLSLEPRQNGTIECLYVVMILRNLLDLLSLRVHVRFP